MNYDKSLKSVDHTANELKLISKMYNEYYTGLFNKVKNAVKNREIVEDLVAEIYCKASQKIRLYNEDNGEISTWLYKIANNHIIDYFRANANKNKNTIRIDGYLDSEGKENFELDSEGKENFEFVSPTSQNADSLAINNETENNLIVAFETLKPKYQEIATMYFINEYSYDEIGNMLNIPLGSVKAMIHRARTKLQESLKVAQMA